MLNLVEYAITRLKVNRLLVGLSPSEPYQSGWSDQDAVCIDDSSGPREPLVAYGGL